MKKKNNAIQKLAHDMKSPLTVLKHYFANADDPEDADMKEFHGAAMRSLDNLYRLIEQMNKLEEKSPFNPILVNIAGAIRSVMERFFMVAGEKGITIKYTGPENIFGNFDWPLIERLITNLITNAIEAFQEKKGGTIQVFLRTRDDDIWVEVRDNAGGIPKTSIHKIFEEGYTSGKASGTGLGLSICKDIVSMHNGNIGVHSLVGQGTVFTMKFPKAISSAGHVAVEPIHEHEDSIH